MDIPETTVELNDSESKLDLYHRPDRLIRISSFSNIVSWITLVISSAIFIYLAVIVGTSLAQGATFINLFSTIMLGSVILLLGIFIFAILQAVAESVFVLMDIEENTRK